MFSLMVSTDFIPVKPKILQSVNHARRTPVRPVRRHPRRYLRIPDPRTMPGQARWHHPRDTLCRAPQALLRRLHQSHGIRGVGQSDNHHAIGLLGHQFDRSLTIRRGIADIRTRRLLNPRGNLAFSAAMVSRGLVHARTWSARAAPAWCRARKSSESTSDSCSIKCTCSGLSPTTPTASS